MKIAAFQFSPEFGEKEENLLKIENAVQKTEADLLVLPELCTTGYQFINQGEVNSLCEPIPDGPTMDRLIRLCKEASIFLVAGLGEKDGDVVYNSAVIIGPEGLIGLYRKIHLFWDEKIWFQPGNLGFSVWDIGIARIGLMICFDWVFPEAARSLALQGADILCHPSNLVLPFCQAAMITRSIENGVFSILTNRIGTEERGDKNSLTFTGGSQVVDPKGNVLFRLETDVENLIEVEIEPLLARDKQITPKNHLLYDRRSEMYKPLYEKDC